MQACVTECSGIRTRDFSVFTEFQAQDFAERSAAELPGNLLTAFISGVIDHFIETLGAVYSTAKAIILPFFCIGENFFAGIAHSRLAFQESNVLNIWGFADLCNDAFSGTRFDLVVNSIPFSLSSGGCVILYFIARDLLDLVLNCR